MTGARQDAGEAMTLGELTEAADVSVRTVRYYIAEGLLPPPTGAGPHSAYGQGHLDRLRLIQRLKERYLPLKEIRRRLAGLEDDEVRLLLEPELEASREIALEEPLWEPSLAEARTYLQMLDEREPYRTEPLPFQGPTAPAASMPTPPAAANLARSRPPRPSGVFPARRPPEEALPELGEQLWRRIPLGEEAELVISDRVFARHRERVDWLVRWARKVFN
jgi:DNA-binding transcriptional MerR regulator